MADWGSRVCAACGYDLDPDEFSQNQWRRGVGISRCSLCVSEGIGRDANGFGTARPVNATRAIFDDLDEPFAEGAFLEVAKGRYTGGTRTGQACVAKWFKDREIFESSYFGNILDVHQKAMELLVSWNQANLIDKTIRLNMPEVWTFNASMGAGSEYRVGQKFLCEPFIQGFEKFNSNSGR
jgi:hypothetical protein